MRIEPIKEQGTGWVAERFARLRGAPVYCSFDIDPMLGPADLGKLVAENYVSVCSDESKDWLKDSKANVKDVETTDIVHFVIDDLSVNFTAQEANEAEKAFVDRVFELVTG